MDQRAAGRLLASVAGLAILLTACAGGGGLSSAEIVEGDNALRGVLELETSEPARVRLRLDSGDHALQVTTTDADTSHTIPLLQLRADREYEIEAELLDPDSGEVTTRESVGSFATGPLPGDLPPVIVDRADTDRMTPGLTLFNQGYRAPQVEDAETLEDEGFLTAVDETGAVVWYHREPLNIQDARRLDDGDLLFISDETGARRITPLGETVGEWRGTSPGSPDEAVGHGLADGDVVDVPFHSMHHEILELPGGDLVTLSRVMEDVTYPEPLCPEDDEDEDGDDADRGGSGEDEASATGPSTEQIVGDAVVVFDPETGEVVEEHSLFDALDPLDDPRKLSGDLCIDYLNRHYPDADPRDWTHANAVIPIDDGTKWLLSLRHTDQLVAIHAEGSPDGEPGSLAWSLGPDEPLELEDEGLWFWHQHAPELQDDGTILVYDNGNGRLDADAPFSRAARYRVDPAAGTAEEVWQHDLGPETYAFFLGDADRLDGTVLITHGGQSSPCEATADDDEDSYVWGRLVEVDEASGDIVFDLRTEDPETCTGWSIYRSERIPTLYPAGYEVEVLEL